MGPLDAKLSWLNCNLELTIVGVFSACPSGNGNGKLSSLESLAILCRIIENPHESIRVRVVEAERLDPQGKTIQGALGKMGYKGLQDVRQGKYFELTLDGGLSRADAEAEVARMAREVLTNPVIEEFRYSIEE